MSNGFRKIFTNKTAAVLLAVLIAIELIWSILLPDWNFSSYTLRTIWNPLATWGCIWYLLAFSFLLVKKPVLKIIIGFIAFPFILFPLIWLLLFGNKPVDTYTNPTDVSILKTIDAHKKIVIREFENTAGEKDYDTAVVVDYFIFRKEISATKPHIEILGL